MDRILETLIASQGERESMNPKALVALNATVNERVGWRYRLEFISSLLDRDVTSTKQLSIAEVYGLLKYLETTTNEQPRQL
jgi:hypothetical protein